MTNSICYTSTAILFLDIWIQNYTNKITKKHFLQVEGGDFKCTLCPKVCKSQRGLTRHKNSKHQQEREQNDSLTGDVSANDEIDPALFIALVNESIKLLSDDMCFPAGFRKQFEIYKFSYATDGSTNQEIFDQIWKISGYGNCQDKRWSPFIYLMALASVIGVPIQSLYPETKSKLAGNITSKVLNAII